MLGALLGVLVFVAAVALSLPAIALGLSIVVTRRSYNALRDLSPVRGFQDRQKSRKLRSRLKRIRTSYPNPTPDAFAQRLRDQLACERPALGPHLLDSFVACARALYEAEGFVLDPLEPVGGGELEAARYRDTLIHLTAKLSDPDALSRFQKALVEAARNLARFLPPFARDDGQPGAASGPLLTVRVADVLSDVGEAIEVVAESICAPSAIASGVFADLRSRLEANKYRMSGQSYPYRGGGAPKLIAPSEYKGAADELVHGYLGGTPLEALFASRLPFEIPDAARMEHALIVAGSGHGKTQCLQYLIGRDLERVARCEASVVVIDSQGDMIKTIAGLKLFAPGEPLHGKLCLIDPTDIEFPVALNLFDVGMERLDRYSPLDRERLLNGILELYDFVLSSLLSAELTSKQSTIFRFITRLLLHIPGATIHTFRELMEPGGLEAYRPHLTKLEGSGRAFFETEFNSKEFADTKRQVARRLWAVLENRTFERMFSHPKNKLDLFAEMNAGKVILINTAKDLLKETSSQIFGRFFIALIAQATQERATLPKDARLPTLVYLDEAQEYLDQHVTMILEQARKQNVGICCATQYLGQLSPKLQESFSANTSIKLAGGVSDKDARSLSHLFRCEPEFISGQPKGHFATYVRNFTAAAVSLRIPFGCLEQMPRMTDSEFEAVRTALRERYAVTWQNLAASGSATSGEIEPAIIDSAAAAEW